MDYFRQQYAETSIKYTHELASVRRQAEDRDSWFRIELNEEQVSVQKEQSEYQSEMNDLHSQNDDAYPLVFGRPVVRVLHLRGAGYR